MGEDSGEEAADEDIDDVAGVVEDEVAAEVWKK